MHDAKYIEFLEKRGAQLHRENQSLIKRVKEYEEKSRKRHLEEEFQKQQRSISFADMRSVDSGTPNFDYKQGVNLRSEIGSDVLSQIQQSGMRPQIDQRSFHTEDEYNQKMPAVPL